MFFLYSVLFSVLVFVGVPNAKAFESPLTKFLDFAKKSKESGKRKEGNKEQSTPANSLVVKNPKNQKKSEEKIDQKRAPEIKNNPREVEEAAEFASEATGVRKDFLMGMLVVESNLGRNPGECTYEEVERGAQESYDSGQLGEKAWGTFKQRRETVKEVADELGYDYKQLRVSCNPGGAYVGTGGAMGIPQFMPDTWMAYKDRIGAIVGKENPDPWDIKDGVVAMALLVSDTPGVTDHSLVAEKNAAKMYLSGTTHFQYEWYANKILYWAQNYGELLTT